MEWTFSEKLKRICNVLSVAYIVIGCAFYSWVMDVRDAYPVQGYLWMVCSVLYHISLRQ